MKHILNILPDLYSDIRNKTSHSISYLLSHRVEDCLSVSGIWCRRLISPILRKAYKNHIRHEIVIDSRTPLPESKKGRIFAVNHRQKDDIIIAMNVADVSAYTVFGGTHIALNTGNGLGLWAYGMIMIDRDSKHSRKSAYEKMKYVINHGGNIIIYPEGYWNLTDDGESDRCHGADRHNSDSWLVQDLNLGAFRLAQETGCEIVPVILHYDEIGKKVCYGHRGAPVKVAPEADIIKIKDDFLSVMQTTYYHLIEKYSSYNRSRLESTGKTVHRQHDRVKAEILREVEIKSTGYKMDMADEKRIGKARNKRHVVTAGEAFSHLKKIVPTPRNAFLFRNRQK